MRLVISLFAVLLAGIAFGSGHADASAHGKRILLLMTENSNPYIGTWSRTFVKAAASDGMKVTNLDSHYDASLQSQQIDDGIAQKYDMIVLVYDNAQAVVPALTRAKAAGVPVVLIITPLKKQYDNLFMSYIGTDHSKLGRFAGEELVEGLAAEGKTKAQVVAITGASTQLNVQMRMAAFKKVLAKHPGIKLVDVEDGKWNAALSEKLAGELLIRFSGRGGIDGIFGMADNQAGGAIQAVQSAGMKLGVKNKGIVVVASNCMKEGIMHIRAGLEYGTATQIPTEEAHAAAKKINAYFNGKKLKKYELVPVHGITRKNVDKFAKGCSY